MNPSKEEVRVNRLYRKIEKLKVQRDAAKAEVKQLTNMLQLYPYIKSDVRRYEERKEQAAELKSLRVRVAEQELLIRLLSGETVPNWEVKHAYDNIIKEEYRKRNAEKVLS